MPPPAPLPAGTSVLIVDDEPANLRLLQSILAEHGFIVRFATNGRMALASVRAEAPDLILLDIAMPDLSGYEVCEQLKADPATAEIPVVFISAAQDVEAKVRSFRVGGVDYLSKPIQVEEVLARIRHQLTIRQQQRQIEAQAERLRELDALKSRFFTDISHEFRTPLMLTVGLVEDARDGRHGPVPPAVRAELDRAVLHAHRLEELIDQILELSRLEAGVARLHAREADVTAHLRGLVASFAPLAERQQVALTLTAPETPLPLSFDPEALTRVVANLLSNAFKHTPAGGHIEVAVRAEQAALDAATLEAAAVDAVVIAVRDTGTGIPADVLPAIFDRFYYRAAAEAHQLPGTGIGLALARELVQLHGGRLEAASHVGEGSTFTVTLPRPGAPEAAPDGGHRTASRTLRHAARSAEAAFLAAGGDGARGSLPTPDVATDVATDDDDVTTVLVVDDNAEVRRYLRTHLARSYRVLEAADGHAALERARTHLPDLIISDVQMPRMDGYALVRALKDDPALDFIPVILLTVKATSEQRLTGLGTGADDYVTKPFRVEELLARADNLIASRRRLRARFAEAHPLVPNLEVETSSADEQFIEQLHGVLEDHLSDPDFTVEDLASALAQDRTTLYRWVRRLLGQSPSDLLRTVRLQQGAALLAHRAGTISEIAYGVGFRSVQHFDRCFRKAYGVTPSVYADRAAALPPHDAVPS